MSKEMLILRDEDGAEWECFDANGGSATPVDDRGDKAFRTLRFRPVDNPTHFEHEMLVSTEMDLSDADIQRSVLRWARQAAERFTN